jgi:hypothetical protein
MSENEENGEQIKKSPDRLIRIEHSGLVEKEQFEKLKSERDELKSVLALSAEKAFRDEKSQVVSQYPENKRDEISELIGEDPSVLEQVKADLKLHGNPVKSRPVGKASLPIRQNQQEDFVQSAEKDDFQQYVDELYRKSRLSSNPSVRDEAEKQIEQLFNEYEKGMSENPDKPFKTVTVQCLQCGSILSGRDAELYSQRRILCPVCGFAGGVRGVRSPKGLPY